jgi:hypothetical protein
MDFHAIDSFVTESNRAGCDSEVPFITSRLTIQRFAGKYLTPWKNNRDLGQSTVIQPPRSSDRWMARAINTQQRRRRAFKIHGRVNSAAGAHSKSTVVRTGGLFEPSTVNSAAGAHSKSTVVENRWIVRAINSQQRCRRAFKIHRCKNRWIVRAINSQQRHRRGIQIHGCREPVDCSSHQQSTAPQARHSIATAVRPWIEPRDKVEARKGRHSQTN